MVLTAGSRKSTAKRCKFSTAVSEVTKGRLRRGRVVLAVQISRVGIRLLLGLRLGNLTQYQHLLALVAPVLPAGMMIFPSCGFIRWKGVKSTHYCNAINAGVLCEP
jgi:hypothetical protein